MELAAQLMQAIQSTMQNPDQIYMYFFMMNWEDLKSKYADILQN